MMFKRIIDYLKRFLGALLFVSVSLVLADKLRLGLDLDVSLLARIIFSLGLLLIVLIVVEARGFKEFEIIKKDFFNQLTVLSRKIKQFINKKWVAWSLIPGFLLFLGLGFSFINVFNSGEALPILFQDQKRTSLVSWKTNELLTGEKIDGEFTAYEDNLGIISIRFNTFGRINDDVLIFRLKEKGNESWYYENEYKVDQFQPDELFPFGFPKIENSNRKIYHFEIESTKGEPENAVAISPQFPIFRVKYHFDQEQLLANKLILVRFLFKKFINIASSLNFILADLFFFVPFFFYLFHLFRRKPVFNFEVAENFFTIVLALFLILQIGRQVIEFSSAYIEINIATDGFLTLVVNFLIFWVLLSGSILALKGNKA
ncbi:MAG TPA: hypothetical protein VMY36_01385 [Patescibacteria group bacterium]|nr:hypothetical protein [Patescibacteria group bacterium]